MLNSIEKIHIIEKIYIIIKQGVYIQGILGVFTNGKIAIQKAQEAIKNEPDDYYDIEIYELPINIICNANDIKYIMKLSRYGKRIEFEENV